jgi:DNA-binding NarL/FixJ family response regulator
MREKIRILLADDHSIVRQGLAALLGREPNMEIIGEACDGRMAVRLTQALLPDVVIMDVQIPEISGIEATHLVSQHPNVRGIGLSMHPEAELAKAMRAAGAVAYIRKDEPIEALIASICTHFRVGRG